MINESEFPMKKILIICTGGTIASLYTPDGLKPQISANELLSYVKEIGSDYQLTAIQPFSLDSTNIQAPHWLKLANIIEEHYAAYDGFVICHGTDTMAYTAAALSYLIQNSPKPIVITGAQKPINLEITDARLNLRDSIRFAGEERACNVNIVFGGRVIAATRAKKERSKSYNAFSSINYPSIAIIHDNRIVFYIDDKDKLKEPLRFYHQLNDRVLLLKLIPSMDGRVLLKMADDYDAFIIESYGVGGLPDYGEVKFSAILHELNKRNKKIVMATQVTREGSDMSIYEVGKNFKNNFDIVEAFDMTLEATVTKTMWLLAHPELDFSENFYRTINHDVLFA